jgi:hypothetical protein
MAELDGMVSPSRTNFADPRSRQGVGSPSTARRSVATLLDLLPWFIAVFSEPAFRHGKVQADWVYWVGIVVFYIVIGLSVRRGAHRGQTLGKQLMGIRSVGDQADASNLRIFGRELLKYLWVGPIGVCTLGVAPVFFLHRLNGKNGGLMWHDRNTGMHVEQLPSEAADSSREARDFVVPQRFSSQAALEEFAATLNEDEFTQLLVVLKSRGWTENEIRERVLKLRPLV